MWNDASGRQVNLTGKLEGGKLAGWVEVRDTKIGGYLDSLNTLFEEMIWQVNSLHSEGSGLTPVTSVVGTVDGLTLSDDLSASADFGFSDRYNAGGSFDVVTYDASGNVLNTFTINPAGNTVQDYIDAINLTPPTGQLTASLTPPPVAPNDPPEGCFKIAASGTAASFTIKPTSGGTSDGALAIMGVNSFFTWNDDLNLTDVTQTIDVNAALTANPDLIAGGHPDSANKVSTGDNSVALAIYALQDKVLTMNGSSTTMDAYYSSLIAEVGVDVQNAEMNEAYSSALFGEYEKRQESIAGVNLDEEMANLLKFQQSYQAAAKIIQMADEMFASLVNI
jgi:flagellar hook-associated protein 1 FlgK